MTPEEWAEAYEAELKLKPGTPFDELFDSLEWCESRISLADRIEANGNDVREELQEMRSQAQQWLVEFGCQFAQAMKAGDSETLREMAKAIDKRARHDPQLHAMRVAILGICCPIESDTFSIRDIVRKLAERGIKPTADDHDSRHNFQRQVRRICGSLGIAIKGERGNKTQKPRR